MPKKRGPLSKKEREYYESNDIPPGKKSPCETILELDNALCVALESIREFLRENATGKGQKDREEHLSVVLTWAEKVQRKPFNVARALADLKTIRTEGE